MGASLSPNSTFGWGEGLDVGGLLELVDILS